MTALNSTPLSSDAHADEEYLLVGPEALLAGTLALMTGYAQSGVEREAMAQKVAGHLQQLAQISGMSPQFRRLLGNLQQRWEQSSQAGRLLGPGTAPTALWHAPSTTRH